MLKGRELSLIFSALFALACGGNAVDVGHSENRGWADAPAEGASATTPQTIYKSEDAIFGFALDDDTLYALVNHPDTFDLVSCQLDRCRSERTVLFSGPKIGQEGFERTSLVVAAGSVYWLINNGEPWSVATCPIAGCEQPRQLATHRGSCLAGDAEGAYWIDSERSLVRMGPDDDAPQSILDLAAESVSPGILLAQGEYLYFNDLDSSLSSIRRVRKDGTSPPELLVADDAISGLAVTSYGLFYASQLLTGRIAKCPLDDCSAGAVTVVANQRWPEQVVVEGDEAFWLNNARFSGQQDHLELLSCPLPDCASLNERASDFPAANPSHIIDGPGQGPTFAVNRNSIVWLEQFRGYGTSFRRLSR